MSDFNPGPTYRGDPGVPHANEKNFTAFMGGLWTVLGLQFCKDVIEVRPLHSPDHVMAMCEEAYKRKQRARGLPYKGKLPSPLAEDQVLPHTKAPRIVKWKLDRLW